MDGYVEQQASGGQRETYNVMLLLLSMLIECNYDVPYEIFRLIRY